MAPGCYKKHKYLWVYAIKTNFARYKRKHQVVFILDYNAMKNFNENNYCVILAGGKGKRLWPVSRENMPKQFLDFFSTGRTLLQQTYERIARFINPDNILVATNREYVELVSEQLPQVPKMNILAEPVNRNTAPSVAWATCRILHRNMDARLVVVPSDQMILDEAAFEHDVDCGLDWVGENDGLLTMGVKPTRPEPGYGYIQLGEVNPAENIFKVKSFTEKPDREFARMFMESGEFYWNTGLFLARCDYLRVCLKRIFPSVLRMIDSDEVEYSVEKEEQCIEDHYSVYPNLSIDYGVLEKGDNVYMMKCTFGWADLGTWHSMYETMSKGEGDNVILSKRVMLDNCRGNIVKLPDDHIAVLNNLDGYIVAEKGNVLLVCKKEDSSALVRKYINEVQMEEGEEFL